MNKFIKVSYNRIINIDYINDIALYYSKKDELWQMTIKTCHNYPINLKFNTEDEAIAEFELVQGQLIGDLHGNC